jgi:hypothetical protein
MSLWKGSKQAVNALAEGVKKVTERVIEVVSEPFWETSFVVFFCPVTGKFVLSNDGNGYSFSMPTKLLKVLAPVVKYGLLAVKIGLASQGLGAIGNILPDTNLDFDFIKQIEGQIESFSKEVTYELTDLKRSIKPIIDELGVEMPSMDDLNEKFTSTMENSSELDGSEIITHQRYSAAMIRVIYKILAKNEGLLAGQREPLRKTGLHLVHPNEGGEGVWVSDEAVEQFRTHGYKALQVAFGGGGGTRASGYSTSNDFKTIGSNSAGASVTAPTPNLTTAGALTNSPHTTTGATATTSAYSLLTDGLSVKDKAVLDNILLEEGISSLELFEECNGEATLLNKLADCLKTIPKKKFMKLMNLS